MLFRTLLTVLLKNSYNTYFTKLLLILVFFTFYACRKVETYPIEPEIQFQNGVFALKINEFDEFDLTFTPTIYFTDGDGNVGWGKSDEKPSDIVKTCDDENTHDLYLNLYEKINGEYKLREFDTDYWCNNGKLENDGSEGNILYANLPFMIGRGQSSALVGDIEYEASMPSLYSDTVYFEIKITDRDGNYSNTVKTSEFIINKQDLIDELEKQNEP